MTDGEVIIWTTGSLAYHDCAATVAQILGLSMPLAAIADDGNGLALQVAEIRVVVVINLDRHASRSCMKCG
jgi:hypothetical protein